MKNPKTPSDPRELDPYSGPKNFDEVLKYLGIDKTDFEAAAASAGIPLEAGESVPEQNEGGDLPESSPRPTRRVIRMPERKTLNQGL